MASIHSMTVVTVLVWFCGARGGVFTPYHHNTSRGLGNPIRRIGGPENRPAPHPQGSARIVDRRSEGLPPLCLDGRIEDFKNHQKTQKAKKIVQNAPGVVVQHASIEQKKRSMRAC